MAPEKARAQTHHLCLACTPLTRSTTHQFGKEQTGTGSHTPPLRLPASGLDLGSASPASFLGSVGGLSGQRCPKHCLPGCPPSATSQKLPRPHILRVEDFAEVGTGQGQAEASPSTGKEGIVAYCQAGAAIAAWDPLRILLSVLLHLMSFSQP